MTIGQELLRRGSLIETLDVSGVALGLVLVLGQALGLELELEKALGLGVGVVVGSLLRCPCQMLRAV